MLTKEFMSAAGYPDQVITYEQLKKIVNDLFPSVDYSPEDLVRELDLHPAAALNFYLLTNLLNELSQLRIIHSNGPDEFTDIALSDYEAGRYLLKGHDVPDEIMNTMDDISELMDITKKLLNQVNFRYSLDQTTLALRLFALEYHRKETSTR